MKKEEKKFLAEKVISVLENEACPDVDKRAVLGYARRLIKKKMQEG